jgi:carbamoyl-phosphate synthase small subunit
MQRNRSNDAMNNLLNHARWLALPLAAALAACGGTASKPWERSGDGVTVRPSADGAAAVRLQVVDDHIIRVTAAPDGKFDFEALKKAAKDAPSMEGAELARAVSRSVAGDWAVGGWDWEGGTYAAGPEDGPKVVVLDYGVKANILRRLAASGARVHVVPGSASAEDVLAMKPAGVVVSNGPGDPAATGQYALETIRGIIDAKVPVLGICLGHQMIALAVGGKTEKMAQGHHGANHPVKNIETGQVEIVSMNHGFAVDRDSLPSDAVETHVSLFDGTNCGFRLKDRPVMSVQHHPEASPGPQDSFGVFDGFVGSLKGR